MQQSSVPCSSLRQRADKRGSLSAILSALSGLPHPQSPAHLNVHNSTLSDEQTESFTFTIQNAHHAIASLQERMTSCYHVCTYCYVKVLALQCPIAGHYRGYGWADVFGRDTSPCATQVKTIDIFRFAKGGNCLESVGRWGLLRQQWGALFAPHTPEMPINRDFYRRRPWNLCKKRPKLPSPDATIRGPKRKNGVTCLSPMGDCLPFCVKNEKVCRQCFHIGKIIYLYYHEAKENPEICW